jgi:dTDP-4-dehydrorhamnose 3,5-epimerase
MKVNKTNITDVKLIVPKRFEDERGFFMETFRADWFTQYVAPYIFVQENHSKSKQGILRGLHYQIAKPQGKLVRVVSGEIYDVALDLRKSSPSFGEAVGVFLSSDNGHQLWVPPGFAHGFYVLSNSAEVTYKCTNYYLPDYERSIIWNDPTLAIEWPLINNQLPLLSDKDNSGLFFQMAECYD